MSPSRLLRGLLVVVLMPSAVGCALFPETRHRDVLHNPFPQLKRVAVLPFTNQSESATLNTDTVTSAYYAALQAIPGFEVMPVGVAKRQMAIYTAAFKADSPGSWSGRDFQQLAKALGVEAVVIGSVTDFDPYYPPRMALTTNWYAANEGFHQIPAGYGLPWGTDAEKQIPRRIVREAEFELARSQLATQTPPAPEFDPEAAVETPSVAAVRRRPSAAANRRHPSRAIRQAQLIEELSLPEKTSDTAGDMAADTSSSAADEDHGDEYYGDEYHGDEYYGDEYHGDEYYGDAYYEDGYYAEPVYLDASDLGDLAEGQQVIDADGNVLQMTGGELCYVDDGLPANWPDPTDLIPDGPAPTPPTPVVNHDPVLTHTKLYRGDDAYFTKRLADYVETGDDARTVGWQGYLKRSEDFIRFCCHLHITEMLESRGGSDQSDLILRWPLSRY